MRNFFATVPILLCLFAMAAISSYVGAQSTPPSAKPTVDDPFDIPTDARTEQEAESFISMLGVPDYHDRERATSELIRVGIRGFRKLRDAYVKTDDPEVRWRIERIVKTAYMDDLVYDRNGFLGISQNTRFYPNHEADERILPKHIGVTVDKVITDTAAWSAGVAENDIIVMINGEPIPNKGAQSAEEFGESIRTRGPGAKITLTVLRGKDQIEIVAVLGRRPKNMYNGASTAINDMLEEARERYDQWWSKHFVVPSERDAQK